MPWTRSNAGPCECRWLERVVAEPAAPVEFNAKLNEYDLVYRGPRGTSRMRLYFCPFCGGAAPKSQRDSLFAQLDHDELYRIRTRLAGLTTVADVLLKLGPPTADHPDGLGVIRPERDGFPPVAETYRTLVYDNLSETVEVRVTALPDGGVHFSYSGKFIGPPVEPDAPEPDSAA